VTALNGEGADRLLVEAAQKDPRRFAELYQAHFGRVYAYVARRLRDRAEAEDVTSDVFHQALANLPRFEWRGVPFGAWLIRIASNAIADRWQRRQRERGTPVAEGWVEPRLEDIDEQARLFELVRQLPDPQRRVIEMRFVEQKTIREIATELGRSEGAVKQLQFRALTALREGMGRGDA
jgi:RNA polymerase sigma-70 factor (ECF subfamily)